VSLEAALALLDDAALEAAEEVASALHHDVGKYVCRVARNVRPGEPVPATLAGMLARDLFETHQGTRASARFESLSRGLPAALSGAPPLVLARGELERIDALEDGVRAARPEAFAEAVLAATRLEAALAGFAKDVRAEQRARAAAGPACIPRSRDGGRSE
jgi:hypothetical protein